MAKVNAPLMSYDARGNIARTIVFSFSRTRNIVKYYKKSANPRTHAQTLQRGAYSDAKDAWNQLTSEEKATFNSRARGRFLTGYNLFLSEYILQDEYKNDFLFGYLLSVFYGKNLFLLDTVFMPEFLMTMNNKRGE